MAYRRQDGGLFFNFDGVFTLKNEHKKLVQRDNIAVAYAPKGDCI